jgi:hypothetical protein
VPTFSVVRESKGKAIAQTLYTGRLRYRAVETFARAASEPGDVITLYRDREVLRKSNEVVTLACSRCHEPIGGDLAPAIAAESSLPVCDDCTRIQRHVNRRAS